MHYKILTRRVTLLVYQDTDNVNYSAACQININGTHGTIDTLIGKDFYTLIKEEGWKMFKDIGLVDVSAAITPAHLRLLKRVLKDTNIIIREAEEPEDIGPGIRLCWIRMTEKSPLE